MKHIIISLCLIIAATSCSTISKTVTIGDVSLLNDKGETIGQWNKSILNVTVYSNGHTYNQFTSLGNGGLKFKDNKGIHHYISGGIVKVDNISTKHYVEEIDYAKSTNLRKELHELETQLYQKQDELKSTSDPNKYNALKQEIKLLKKQMRSMETELYMNEIGFSN